MEEVPVWVTVPSSSSRGSRKDFVTKHKLPPDVVQNITDFHTSISSLGDMRTLLARIVEESPAYLQQLERAVLSMATTSNHEGKLGDDLMREVHMSAAVQEDLLRYLMHLESCMVSGFSAQQSPNLDTHRMVHTVKERTVSLSALLKSTKETLPKAEDALVGSVKSIGDVLVQLEEMDALMEAVTRRKAAIQRDVGNWGPVCAEPQLSFSLPPELRCQSAEQTDWDRYIERGEVRVRSSCWKQSAGALRKLNRPVLSLNLFEDTVVSVDKRAVSVAVEAQQGRAAVPLSRSAVCRDTTVPSSVFTSVVDGIERYDVVRVVKAAVTPPPAPKPKSSLPSALSATASPGSEGSAGGASKCWTENIEDLVRQKRPDYLPDLPRLLTKYRGREEDLLKALEKKLSAREERPRSGSRTRSLSGDLESELTPTIGRKNSMHDDEAAGRERSNSKTLGTPAPTTPFASSMGVAAAPPLTPKLTPMPAAAPVAAAAGPFSFGQTQAATAAASTSTPVVPVQSRVEEIYRQYNPSKLAEIPQLMKKYAGKEAELVEKLEKKYNVPKAAAAVSAATAPAWGVSAMSQPTPQSAAPSASPFGSATPGAAGWGAGTAAKSSLFSPPTPAGFSSPAPAASLFASPAQQSAGFGQPPPALGMQGFSQPSQSNAFGLSPGFGAPSMGTQQSPFGAAPAPISSVGAGPGQLQDVTNRVQQIYQQYNPAKLSEIPQLLEKYRGRELQLIANLEKKYNCAAGGPAAATSSFGGVGGGNMFASPAQQQQQHQQASPFGGGGAHSLFGNRPQQQSPAWGQTAPTTPVPSAAWGQSAGTPVQGSLFQNAGGFGGWGR